MKLRAESYRAENGLAADALVPGDAVTASGSGLDPHISLRNADLQAPRVARSVLDLAAVERHREGDRSTLAGHFGEPGVNVLKLNLALDGAN